MAIKADGKRGEVRNMIFRTFRVNDKFAPRYSFDPNGDVKEIDFYFPKNMSEKDAILHQIKAMQDLRDKGLLKDGKTSTWKTGRGWVN